MPTRAKALAYFPFLDGKKRRNYVNRVLCAMPEGWSRKGKKVGGDAGMFRLWDGRQMQVLRVLNEPETGAPIFFFCAFGGGGLQRLNCKKF